MYSSNSRRFTSFFVPTNKTKGQLGALSILLSHGRFPLYFTTDISLPFFKYQRRKMSSLSKKRGHHDLRILGFDRIASTAAVRTHGNFGNIPSPCSRLYPLRDQRISADDDLFIPEGEFFVCHEALLANGLTTDTPADELPTADEVSYTKKDSPLYIELHRHLFDSAQDAHDELNHFFVDIAPVEVDGFLTMPPHEHLLYLILHAYKHFVYSGIGLRQFCDIGLWAQAYHDQIDWQRLHDQCASVHAATFAAAAFRIARTYLGIDFDLPGLWDGDVDVEPLLHDTLCGGVYGSNSYTRLHSSTVTLNAVKASRTGEKSSVLRTVFPKRAYLERRYPYLKKRPYLLPVAWVQRIAHYAGEQSGADNSASGSIKLAKERIELMKLYGIIDEKK